MVNMRNYTNSDNHRFTLAPYKGRGSRAMCPYCSVKDCFSNYIDTHTGEIINDSVGRCNREDKCSAHYTPSQYFADNPHERTRFFDDTNTGEVNTLNQPRVIHRPQPKDNQPPSFINGTLFNQSLAAYHRNDFYHFLTTRFGQDIADVKVKEYHIGTSKQWDKNSTVLWQVDRDGNIRTGKIMLFNPSTGKRVKQPFTYITWVHSALKIEGYNLQQCLYGLHLLNNPDNDNKPCAIVESEKTAVIASIYLPQYVWLATGAKLHLNENLFEPLQGRDVVFYPDLGAYGEWVTRADKLKHLITVTIDNTLNDIATEAEYNEGLDIADYLLRQDYRQLQLRQSFIDEIMKLEQDSPHSHRAIATKYIKQGLDRDEAQRAVITLIDKYGFQDTAA